MIGNARAVYDIPTDGKLVASNHDVSFSTERIDLADCWKIGDNYFCLSLIRRKHDMTDSCEVALYLNQLENIRELCNIRIKAIPEMAIALNNREALIFSDRQTLEIQCVKTEPGNEQGLETRHDPTIEGLVRIKLPEGEDCKVSTIRHSWRADIYLEKRIQSRENPLEETSKKCLVLH